MHLSILLGFSTLWGTTNGANDLFTPQSLWEARKVNNKHQMWVGIQDLTQRRFLSWCPKAEERNPNMGGCPCMFHKVYTHPNTMSSAFKI